MSRAPRIEGLLASQTCTSWIELAGKLNHGRESGKLSPVLGIHGLRRERFRQLGEIPRITSGAVGYQPGQHHDPQDLRTRFNF
jgi:hypothetical protein